MWVLGYHTLPRSASNRLWFDFWEAGHAGVTLFFVLSGFVLVYTYGSDRDDVIDARSFLGARVARIYPVYLLALVISIPEYVRFIRGLVGIPALTTLQTVLVTLTTPLMLQAWLTGQTCRWNCPSWTLSVEAFFYVLFPLLAPLLRGRSPKVLASVAVGGVVIMFGIASMSMNQDATELLDPVILRNVYPHWPLFRLPEFLLGMAIGRWYTDRRAAGISLHRKLGHAATRISVVAIVALSATHSIWGDSSRIIAVLAIPFALLILGAAESGGGVLAWQWLVLLGEASYAFYIIHAPLHVYFLGASKRLFPGSIAEHPWPIFSAYLGTVLIGSVLIYQYLERPARRALRRRLVHRPRSA